MERQLTLLLGRLPAGEFRHLLLVRGGRAADVHRLCPPGPNIQVVVDPADGPDRLWGLRLATILQRHAVDLIHVRGLSMLVDAVIAARVAGALPVVFSFHGLEEQAAPLGHIRRLALRSALTQCAARFAVSDGAAAALAGRLGVSRASIEFLHNGVDVRRFAPSAGATDLRRALGLPIDRLVVLNVGNIKPIKGHGHLVEAVAALGPSMNKATFVIIGEDHLGGAIQREAARRLPGGDVRFPGRVDDVLPWYQAADVFVLPSLYEGASNALLEAMACGLACVATDVGGNREVVAHGRSGLLAPPGDPGALAAALRFLFDDPGQRRALGRAAREVVCARYDIDRTWSAYADAYSTAAADRTARRAALPTRTDSAQRGTCA